jgi:hypothetical protein
LLHKIRELIRIKASKIVCIFLKKDTESLLKKPNPNRIKSWEYEKWDKFNVEAELTKMEVTDMQISEWEKREKPKLTEEQKTLQNLMKNDDILPSVSTHCRTSLSNSGVFDEATQKSISSQMPTLHRRTGTTHIPEDKPSFIEDVTDASAKAMCTRDGPHQIGFYKPKRRIKVIIEDVNAGGC